MSESTELTVVGALVPAIVFAEGGVDAVMARLRAEALSAARDLDISTPQGRAAIASLAYKVARSKTALDKMGKELGEENYRAWKRITAERSKIERECDALRDEVRKPLDEYEAIEAARIEGHETELRNLAALAEFPTDEPPVELVEMRIGAARRLMEGRNWQEFHKRAEDTTAATVGRLMQMRDRLKTLYAEREEAARLAAEEAARLQRERDEGIAAEAAERARLEAEAKAVREAKEAEDRARQEREAIETRAREAAEAAERAKREAEAEAMRRADEAAETARLQREAIEAKARKAAEEAEERRRDEAAKAAAKYEAAQAKVRAAEAERIAAERRAEQAEADRLAAVEQERQRVAAEQEAARQAEAAREADKAHKRKINGAARDALLTIEGMTDELARAVVAKITIGAVPNVKISY